MPYGTYAQQANRYREIEVLSATPEQLVLIMYDHVLMNLGRVRNAGADDIDARSEALSKCRATLTELLATLNHDKGGPIASSLAALYRFLIAELATLGVRSDPMTVDRLLRIVQELRNAFAAAAVATQASVA